MAGGLVVAMVLVLYFGVVWTTEGGGLRRREGGGVSEAYSHGDSESTLYSSDNYLKCTSDLHVTPTSTAEVSETIKRYAASGQPVKIRATRRGFHSSAGFVCSGTRGSSKKEYHDEVEERRSLSITMLMHRMNGVEGVDKERKTMTVGAGMTLWDLRHAMDAAGLAAPPGTLSIYGNLTVGGVILASAHGSGYRVAGSLIDLVTSIEWVNARGEILTSNAESEDGRALLGGLGLLGVATKFTLALRAPLLTVVETRKRLDDATIVADLKRMLEAETPHVIAFWRPDFGTYKALLWTPVDEAPAAPRLYPNASIQYLTPIPPDVASLWSSLMRAWEEDSSPTSDALEPDIRALAEAVHDVSMFQDADGTVIDHGVIPTNRAMVSEDCSPACLFHVHHMGMFAEDTEFTIKLAQLEDWVEDVKRVVGTRCMPPGYFWIRFGRATQNLLSTSTGGEDVAYVQWTHLHSALLPDSLSKRSEIVETIEQLTLCKYRGRPHWGKNHERVFRHPECHVRDHFPSENFEQLLALQKRHDPGKLFEPEMFREVLERSGPEYAPLCTPHFWCYCREDAHCSKGYACRSSPSFPEYKVCRLVEDSALRSLERDAAEL